VGRRLQGASRDEPRVWGGPGLPFFDNCIFDGRDTLAAPLCFLQLRVFYVRVWGTVWAPCLMMDGVGYELCAD